MGRTSSMIIYADTHITGSALHQMKRKKNPSLQRNARVMTNRPREWENTGEEIVGEHERERKKHPPYTASHTCCIS